MDSPTATPKPEIQPKSPTSGQVSKKVYLVLFVGIILIIAVLVYFLLVASEGDEESTENSQKEATASAENKTPEPNFETAYVTAAEGLNLREEASTDALIVLLLPAGTELKIISSSGDWYFVEAQTRGYVSKEFVSESKPTGTTLLTFNNSQSPFKFLYPDVYKVELTKADKVTAYNFTGNQSFGGFKVETVENMATLGNYALQNYPQAAKSGCEPIQFGTQAKECEKVVDSSGTTYLLLVNTTLYKISYLKTEGGLLTDLNNLVFYSLYFD